jgi:transcriptional regulator with GAF, ATPase, and Fis domain
VAVVLVYVAEEGASRDRALPGAVLSRAVAVGARTIGISTDVAHLSLERRCQLLLSGIEVLVDAAAPTFAVELRSAVSSALDRHGRRRSEGARIDGVLAELGVVAVSSTMRSVLRRLVMLAELGSVPVLLQGETGTGKEIAARILHARDPRRAGGPFVAVNCAALSKTLAESELFGHRRGAFSGAFQDRPGLVRSADGGVLFLDEVGELDLELQGKLLRVIQEGRVLAVGDDREHPTDVRVVAATHRDLGALVRVGRFREDLYYRLSVIRVELPALRDRREDIPPLCRHFAAKHAGLHDGRVPELADDFLNALGRMALPGNVRELENLVRSSLTTFDRPEVLTLRELPREALSEIASTEIPLAASRAVEPTPGTRDFNLTRAVETCERTLIEAALAESKGSQVDAAKLLGVTARTVFNLVRRHGLEVRPMRRTASGTHRVAHEMLTMKRRDA